MWPWATTPLARAVSAGEAPAVTAPAVTPSWFYGIDITLQPAVVVFGAADEQAVADVAQLYSTQVQRPVLVLAGPAPADAQITPVSGITGELTPLAAFAEGIAAVQRGIEIRPAALSSSTLRELDRAKGHA